MKILFYTFPEGHTVSDKEHDRLKKGFQKVDMELVRWHKNKGEYMESYDVILVKGFSHLYDELPKGKLITYLSIGTEWKINATPELNEPIKELYRNADAVVHISSYCLQSHDEIFGYDFRQKGEKENISVIIPADEPKLNDKFLDYNYLNSHNNPLKLATTCIPRPVKRSDQLEALCKKYDIELVPAWGGVFDFSYYHDCDGYIHLSRKEGMPNTVLEALAYGLPCIVTNYGGASEAVGDAGIIIKNDPDGVAWDPDNILPVDELLFVHAIEEFKRRLPELRIKVRERVLSELNDYVAACKFKEVFESLL